MNISLMKHWENSTWSIEPIRLQLMDANCKRIYAHAYTVPRSVEQRLRKEIVRLVDIGVLKEELEYSSE
jgi:hypothetical protein